jgi:hypothetical protein
LSGSASLENAVVTNDMRTTAGRQIAFTFIPALAILALVLATAAIARTPIGYMTRDMATIGELHPLAGILSNLGVLLWCASAAVCLFAALGLRAPRSTAAFRFLLCSAALSAYLLIDDFFMVHEELAPRYLGLNDKAVVAALGAATCAYVLAFWRLIAQTQFAVLALALGLLGASAGMDALLWPWVEIGGLEFFIEDGAKWLGIALWCSYYVRTAHQVMAGRVGLPSERAAHCPSSDVRHVGPGAQSGLMPKTT